MNVQTFVMGYFSVNSYLVWCPTERAGVAIDPGAEPGRIISYIEKENIHLQSILLTHAHYDHVEGIDALEKKYPVPVIAHVKAPEMLNALPHQAAMFDLSWDKPIPTISRELDEGDSIQFGREEMKVFYTPGHSPCSISFIGKNEAFVGDLIFFDAVGRTDFIGGSLDELMSSIRQKIFNLPPSMTLYCGHGPVTTVERELRQNPFV